MPELTISPHRRLHDAPMGRHISPVLYCRLIRRIAVACCGKAKLYPKTQERSKGDRGSMKRVISFATLASSFVATYLVHRRAESLASIAKQAITNPVGSMVSDLKTRSNG